MKISVVGEYRCPCCRSVATIQVPGTHNQLIEIQQRCTTCSTPLQLIIAPGKNGGINIITQRKNRDE